MMAHSKLIDLVKIVGVVCNTIAGLVFSRSIDEVTAYVGVWASARHLEGPVVAMRLLAWGNLIALCLDSTSQRNPPQHKTASYLFQKRDEILRAPPRIPELVLPVIVVRRARTRVHHNCSNRASAS